MAVSPSTAYNQASKAHLYTASANENKQLPAQDKNWQQEGIAWQGASSGDKVYRIYNPKSGEHLYSSSSIEIKSLTDKGWTSEGVAFYSVPSGGQPVYRLYNAQAGVGAHFNTLSSYERDVLVSKHGWRYEGIAWYAQGSAPETPSQPDDQPINIYFARHGKTMFNVLDRLQGWSDSPLTADGIRVAKETAEGIKHGIPGDKVHPDLKFDLVYSGDAGRHQSTAKLFLDQLGQSNLPIKATSDFRESGDGDFEGLTFEEGNKGIYELAGYNYDKEGKPLVAGGYNDKGVNYQAQLFANGGRNLKAHLNWLRESDVKVYGQNPNNPDQNLKGIPLAEDYDRVIKRMKQGTEEVINDAQKGNRHNVLVVSSGLSLEVLLTSLDPTAGDKYFGDKSLANASISKVTYNPKDKTYKVDYASDTAYSKEGQKLLAGKN
ncbi:histidine phosphatase family protein [Lactococcus termiticola]